MRVHCVVFTCDARSYCCIYGVYYYGEYEVGNHPFLSLKLTMTFSRYDF